MADALKKTYFSQLIPAIAFLIISMAIREYTQLLPASIAYPPFFAALIFFLSVLFALAGPVFYRSVFAHRVRDLKNTPHYELIRFERNLIRIALVTPYLSIVAYLFEFPNLYFGGSILMSLYAIYYFYPSGTRLNFEKRIFRVRMD